MSSDGPDQAHLGPLSTCVLIGPWALFKLRLEYSVLV